MRPLVEYVPIITTVLSIVFFIDLYRHYTNRPKSYLFWWMIGVLTFGLGTMAESINAVFGFSAINLRYWYIVGALLGGFPLAQGTVYLLMPRKFAYWTTILLVSVIIIASVCVAMSPVVVPEDFDGRLSGKLLEWSWVRMFSPFINLYAFIFLVGGAIYSAWKYYKQGIKEAPFKGNIFIAIGGLLPGIGGSFTRFGYVEVLYITELLGLLLIYYGYKIIRNSRKRMMDKYN